MNDFTFALGFYWFSMETKEINWSEKDIVLFFISELAFLYSIYLTPLH